MSETETNQKPADQSQAIVHTPGPWAVNYMGSVGHLKSVWPDHKFGWTPTLAKFDRSTRAQSINDDEALANATLMAAAPDLLESCRELVQAMRDYEMEVDGDKPEKHRRMMRRASAAIKKATSVL